MKQPTAAFRQKYYEGKPIYTYAEVSIINKSTNNRDTKILTPSDFRVTGNSYTQSCSNDCPIGNVLSKSITLTISNQHKEWAAYDWGTAVIDLKSEIIDGLNYRLLSEGRFYVNTVQYVSSAIEITAFDMISFMDYEKLINTRNPSTGATLYSTVWDYFVALCSEFATKMGISYTLYTDRCSSLLNMPMPEREGYYMVAIPPDSKSKTTFRDIMGYMAQLAGGNMVVVAKTVGGTVQYKIDIIPIRPLVDIAIYHAGEITDEISDFYIAGEVTEEIEDFYIGKDSEHSDYDYIILDKFQDFPQLEYSDTVYTDISIEYPIKSSAENDKKATGSSNNILALFNPLLEIDTANQHNRLIVAQALKIWLCGYPIRPFEGTFKNNPLIELGDNVLIQDAHGDIYQSYITEHEYHYLAGSDLSNNCKTQAQNNNTFYR